LYKTKVDKILVRFIILLYYDHSDAMHHFKQSNALNLAHAS